MCQEKVEKTRIRKKNNKRQKKLTAEQNFALHEETYKMCAEDQTTHFKEHEFDRHIHNVSKGPHLASNFLSPLLLPDQNDKNQNPIKSLSNMFPSKSTLKRILLNS